MSTKRRKPTFLVLVTFDLHRVRPAAYTRVKDRLANLDLRKVIRSKSTGRVRKLPANTFAAKFVGRLPDSKSSPLRDHVRAEVKRILQDEGLKATVFVAVGQRWAWDTIRVKK